MPPDPPTHTTNLTSQALITEARLLHRLTQLSPARGPGPGPHPSCQSLRWAAGRGGEGSWSGAQHVLSNVCHFISTKHISCSQEFVKKKRIKTTWDSTHQIMNVSRRFELLTCHKLTTASFDHQVLSLWQFQHDWIAHFLSFFFLFFFFFFLKLAWFSLELV